LIVEVGCGTGKLLLKVAEKLKPMRIIGTDISRAMIKISKRNASESRDLVDLILSTGTLHHIRQPQKFFNERIRVLRKNGEAWIYEFSHDVECKTSKPSKDHAYFLGSPPHYTAYPEESSRRDTSRTLWKKADTSIGSAITRW